MAKRRKRTNRNVPAKGRLRDMADALWSLAVKADWNHRCAVCGKSKTEAHHLICRQHQATRYELRNGIALCSRCHQFDPDISPHQNASGWLLWLIEHHEKVHHWYRTEDEFRKPFKGITNAAYYIDHIRRLGQYVEPEEFERIVGIKFARYLEEDS